MSKLIDLTGQRFGKLTVLERVGSDRSRSAKWKCLCDCGLETIVRAANLKNGHIKSCGCLRKNMAITKNTKHSGRKSRLYRIWYGIKDRCCNPHCHAFKNYGGRGITVCDEWRYNFVAFRDWALSHGYSDELSIDRIDNDKGYYPENCRWATALEQNRNRRYPKQQKEV